MKKVFTLLTITILLLSTCMPVMAKANSGDDFSDLTDEIVMTVNDLFADKLNRKVTANDIDYDKSFKIYVGTDIFDTNVNNIAEIPDAFGSEGYIYELPIYIDQDTIIVNIAKGQPLNESAVFTDEERQNIIKSIGKWQVTAVKHYSGETIDYQTELQGKIGYIPNRSVLVGGLPHFRFAVALLPDADGTIKSIVPLSDVPGIELINTFRTNENTYDYQAVKEYINQLPPPTNDEAGIYGFFESPSAEPNTARAIVMISIILLAVGLCTVVIYYRKRD